MAVELSVVARTSCCPPYRSLLTLVQINNGFLEGIVRGYKGALLTQSNYSNLTQCENLEGALSAGSSRA